MCSGIPSRGAEKRSLEIGWGGDLGVNTVVGTQEKEACAILCTAWSSNHSQSPCKILNVSVKNKPK